MAKPKTGRVERTIIIRGPFREDEVRAFWRLMQSFEAKRPQQRFKFLVDESLSPEMEGMFDRLERMAPLAEGYARIVSKIIRDKGDKGKMN